MKSKTFIKGGEGAIGSYNWTDIADGAGYSTFYLSRLGTSGAVLLSGALVTSSAIKSDDVLFNTQDKADLPSTADSLIFNDTFTTTMNSPRVVNGNVIVNLAAFCFGVVHTYLYFLVQFIRIRGGTETVLGSSYSAQMRSGVSTPDQHEKMFNIQIPITNQMFKKGDLMGIRVKAYSWVDAAGSPTYCLIGHDPANRTSILTAENAITTTNSNLNVPFRIDL